MMIEIGEWVIETALTQISHWQREHHNLPLSTYINIAAVEIQQPDFADRLATLLAAHPDVELLVTNLTSSKTLLLNQTDVVRYLPSSDGNLAI